MGDAKRIFRGIEMVARKQFSNQLWAQASFLYSSLKGNYSGAIREASGQTDPGINADYDYYQFTFNDYGKLELDRPVQARIDAVYNAPFGLSMGAQFYVRSGLPVSRFGWFNDFYPDLLYLDTRGENNRSAFLEDSRTPTDYDLNLSLAYNMNLGPVTITPQVYLFNVINQPDRRPAMTRRSTRAASFVTDPTSPFYGQAGLAPGEGTCSASAAAPCPDNQDYLKVEPAQQPAAPPRGAQGHLLESFFGDSSGAASAAPFFLSPVRKVQGLGCGFKGTRSRPFGTRPRSCVSSLFSVT